MPGPAELGALIERAKQGDVRAFEQLLADQIPRVRRFARAMSGNAADADDLAQEALLKVFTSLHGYRFQATFSTWLFRIVRNAFIDAARRKKSRREELRDPSAPEYRGVPDPDNEALPDEALARSQLRAVLLEALRQVPLEFRVAVTLFDVEGLAQEEIAAIEGVPLGTVKSRLSRGRAHLRAVLSAQGIDPSGNADAGAFVQMRESRP
jgi:RNA polymerase sigma-70 factor (ECF subfamily)